MNPQWLAKYKPISDALMVYGWFVAPFLIGAEFKVVEQTADYIAQNPPQSEQDRKNIEDRIYRSLVEPAFSAAYGGMDLQENWSVGLQSFSFELAHVLHGMDAGNFYRPQDVHRLILAFDPLIEFLSFQQGVFHTFLPDVGTDAFVDARRNYYGALSFGMPTAAQFWAIERTLLKQHARYVAPPHDPNIQESIAAHAALMAEITELGKRARAKDNTPKPPPSATA